MNPTTSTGNQGDAGDQSFRMFTVIPTRLARHDAVAGQCVVCQEIMRIDITDLDLNGLVCPECQLPVAEAGIWLRAADLAVPSDALISLNP